jgi:hypothetical protein
LFRQVNHKYAIKPASSYCINDLRGNNFSFRQYHLKKRDRAKILASVTVGIGQLEGGEQVSAKIVFVRDRRTKKKWLALLTTDTKLPDEEVVRIYGKRWSIEVFFKMSKSYLKLAKEFQRRSYDSMVASTAIMAHAHIPF